MTKELRTERTSESRSIEVIALIVMSAAITGYFIGIKSPMNPEQVSSPPLPMTNRVEPASSSVTTAIPATAYADMSVRKAGPNRDWATSLTMLKPQAYDPLAEIKLDPQQKLVSLSKRAELRAFNTAPPTVPHPIDQMSSQGCLACHGEGVRTETFRIAKMPHPFYANCTQCHVEKETHDLPRVPFSGNTFVGMAAPTSGPRAYDGAPPVVPHSTWMRNQCLSCHGRAANPGLETTHPWRQNCLQCHGISAALDQTNVSAESPFLPPPVIEKDKKNG